MVGNEFSGYISWSYKSQQLITQQIISTTIQYSPLLQSSQYLMSQYCKSARSNIQKSLDYESEYRVSINFILFELNIFWNFMAEIRENKPVIKGKDISSELEA